MRNNPEFFDIYGYYQTPFLETTSFKVLVAALSLLFLLLITFFIVRKRRKRQLSPWEKALKKLNTLHPAQCTTKSDFKSFYFTLTSTIKTYLQDRYGWKIFDKTDDEIVFHLKKQNFDRFLLNSLSNVFHSSVWARFANERSMKTQAEKDLKMAIEFINKTKPVETP